MHGWRQVQFSRDGNGLCTEVGRGVNMDGGWTGWLAIGFNRENGPCACRGKK